MNAPAPAFHTRITTPVPEMIPGPIPVEPYVSPTFFERERERIFKRAWLQVAREEDLPKPGDYRVQRIAVLGTSVLLTRARDGRIRAFHNLCPHRGNEIAARYPDQGNTGTFVCGYHGWTFELDGRLRALPGEGYFPDCKRDELALRPLACDTWAGFVFINWNPQPEWPLRQFVGGMADQLEGYPFGAMERVARYSANVAVNWKTFMDAFHETYHVGMVHAHSLKGCSMKPEKRAAFDALASARFYPPHHSASNALPEDALEITPLGALAWQMGVSFAANEEIPRLPGTNPSDDPRWYFDINVFFPNFFCDVGPGWYFTYNFWPISVDETRWVMDIYQFAAQNPGQRLAQEHTKVLLRDLLYEDLSTMESQHRALKSGVLTHLNVSDEMEIAVRHQYTNVMRWVNGEA
jgi:phenylpropionate dioxygenase-like ring-hydroxylating dioxygenase large terminal subunit